MVAVVAINWVAVVQIREATQEASYEGFEEKVEILVDVVEDGVAPYIEQDGGLEIAVSLLQPDLNELAKDLDISIRLIDLEEDWVFYDSDSGRMGFTLGSTRDVDYLYEFDEPQDPHEGGGDYLTQARFVYLEDDPAVILRVRESWLEAETTLRNRSVGMVGGSIVVGLLFVGLLGGGLARVVIRPLTQLRTSAQAMGKGRLDVRAETDGPAEVRLLAQDFNVMATAVEQMVAQQKAFASNAAHELRTPLTAIRLRTETLLEDEPDEALQQRYLLEIQNEVVRLGRLVDDLRLLSRADAQRLQTGVEQVDLAFLLNRLIQEFRPLLDEKSIDLTVDIEDGRYTMRGSTNQLRIVLRNVLENGVKYTPAGEQISVSLKSYLGGTEIEVRDTGIGIAAEDLPRLFERFYRADKAHSRKIAGSGLGLSLAKSIMALYGGDIVVQSAGLGRGTAVSIRFPQQDEIQS